MTINNLGHFEPMYGPSISDINQPTGENSVQDATQGIIDVCKPASGASLSEQIAALALEAMEKGLDALRMVPPGFPYAKSLAGLGSEQGIESQVFGVTQTSGSVLDSEGPTVELSPANGSVLDSEGPTVGLSPANGSVLDGVSPIKPFNQEAGKNPNASDSDFKPDPKSAEEAFKQLAEQYESARKTLSEWLAG